MATIYEAMMARRSVRKFTQKEIPDELLKNAVDVARMAPAGGNMQSLKFCVVKDPELVSKIFALSKWGMHLKDGSGQPKPGEEPTVWFLVLNDSNIRPQPFIFDVAASLENIIIYLQGEGVATCWLENIRKKEIGELLGLPENLTIASSVAAGWPAQAPVAVPLPENGATPYYWGEDGVLQVPKRALEDVLIMK